MTGHGQAQGIMVRCKEYGMIIRHDYKACEIRQIVRNAQQGMMIVHKELWQSMTLEVIY
jgi:hypothetical protein